MDKEEKNQDYDTLILRRYCPASLVETARLIESAIAPFMEQGWCLVGIDHDFGVEGEGVATFIRLVRPASEEWQKNMEEIDIHDYEWRCSCGEVGPPSYGTFLGWVKSKAHREHLKVLVNKQTGVPVATSVAEAREKDIPLLVREASPRVTQARDVL